MELVAFILLYAVFAWFMGYWLDCIFEKLAGLSSNKTEDKVSQIRITSQPRQFKSQKGRRRAI